MKKLILSAAFVAVAILPTSAAYNQYWQQGYINYTPVKDKDSLWNPLSLSISEDYRYDEQKLYYFEHFLMANYRLCPYFGLSIGYVYARNRPGHAGSFKTENRYEIDANFYAPEFWTLKFDCRMRMEFRNIQGSQMYNRYRVRPKIGTSWSVTDFKISPYVSNEFFFSNKPDTDKEEVYDHNRLQVGFNFKPFPERVKDLSACLYYQALYDINAGSPTHWNCYCLSFTYKF